MEEVAVEEEEEEAEAEEEEEEEEEEDEEEEDRLLFRRSAGRASEGRTPMPVNQPRRAPIFKMFVSTAKESLRRRYNKTQEVVFTPIPEYERRSARVRSSSHSSRSSKASSDVVPNCSLTLFNSVTIMRDFKR